MTMVQATEGNWCPLHLAMRFGRHTLSQAAPTPQEQTSASPARDASSIVAIVCGVLALLAAFIVYWLVLVSVGLGIVAVILGLRVRSRSGTDVARRELAVAAIVLGLVGILATPAALMISKAGEEWGRDCALGSPDPNC